MSKVPSPPKTAVNRRVYSVSEIEVACRALDILRDGMGLPASALPICGDALNIIREGLAEIRAEHDRRRE